MARLTDTQLVILSAAARREDGAALPLPSSIRADDKARTAALRGLLKARLLAEQPAARDDAAWREGKDGQRLTLVITDAGRATLDDGPDEKARTAALASKPSVRKGTAKKPAPKGTGTRATPKPPKVRKGGTAATVTGPSGTKQQAMIDLLHRPGGATIEEAMKATGWQAHSVRGFISGALKKKLGLTVDSEKVEDRGRVYRIVP
jgi:hypothetical protein